MRTGCSTPSSPWSAGWSATGTTSATSPTSTPTGTAARSSSIRSSYPLATMSTGRQDNVQTSPRPATPAWTSPSSAATRSTGRRAGRTLPTVLRRHSGRWSRSRKAMPPRRAAASTGTATTNSPATRTRTPGPGSGARPLPGHDGGLPENGLTGQISWVNSTTAIQVPAAYATNRIWRNTSIAGASGTTALEASTLGYEWDGYRPEFATAYPAGPHRAVRDDSAGATHQLSLYRDPESNALVFGAGTVQWAWGLDGVHDRGSSDEDPRMQQATVNLLSDMGAQPGSLQVGAGARWSAGRRRPRRPPSPSPTAGDTVPGGDITVSGTAADTGGIVASVEVSVDGGTTWQKATGTTAWSHTFSAPEGTRHGRRHGPSTMRPISARRRASVSTSRRRPARARSSRRQRRAPRTTTRALSSSA